MLSVHNYTISFSSEIPFRNMLTAKVGSFERPLAHNYLLAKYEDLFEGQSKFKFRIPTEPQTLK